MDVSVNLPYLRFLSINTGIMDYPVSGLTLRITDTGYRIPSLIYREIQSIFVGGYSPFGILIAVRIVHKYADSRKQENRRCGIIVKTNVRKR